MSKYIGTPVVSLSTDTVDVTGDITTTDATPEVIIVNDTHEDTDGGREGKLTFKGQASGGEETTLAQIQASHDGTSDDEKGDLIFKTNDGSDGASPTEAMRIDSSGNVGIGTSSPSNSRLYLTGSGFAGQLLVAPTTSAYVGVGHGTDHPAIHWQTGDFRFATSTASDLTGFSEKMRIDASGNLLVGTTSNVTTGSEGIELRGDAGYINTGRNSTGSVGHFLFYNPNGNVGSITTSGSSTAFNTSSDHRLKENVVELTGATDRLKQLSPKRFNFIADADKTVDGFLAHEAATVVPEAVTGTKDAVMDEEYTVTAAKGDVYTPATDDADEVVHSSNVEQPETLEEGQQWRETAEPVMGTRSVADYQGIDQSKIVPLLTAALQEAIAKIETLETKVAALEGE